MMQYVAAFAILFCSFALPFLFVEIGLIRYSRWAAGVIHSDIQRGFIRAEIMKYADLIEHGRRKALKKPVSSIRQITR